jgi:hypothetical protein
VTHEVGRYIYFYVGQKGFLIWSTVSTHTMRNNAYCYSLAEHDKTSDYILHFIHIRHIILIHKL